MPEAVAFWVVGPGRGELRPEVLAEPTADQVLVETIASGISRGTETLVFRGRVPASQWFPKSKGELVEEVIGLGRYGKTLTVLTVRG